MPTPSPTVPESARIEAEQLESIGRVPVSDMADRTARRNPILTTSPGAQLHGCTVTAADHEVEHRITRRFLLARTCEKHHRIADARLWTSLMQAAIRQRRPEVVAAWEAEERERLDCGTFAGDWAHKGASGL